MLSQRTQKCEAERGVEGTDIIRHWPYWLERLVIARQQQTAPEEKIDVGKLEIKPDETSAFDTKMEDAVNSPDEDDRNRSNFFDSKTYYENDSLPTLDLSQLTLSLDSDLIFSS